MLRHVGAAIEPAVGLGVSRGDDHTLADKFGSADGIAESPDGLDAVQLPDGDIRVDLNLYGTATDEKRAVSVNIYHDNGTGTIDYATIVGSTTSDLAGVWNSVSVTLTGLTPGTVYKIGARAVSSTGDLDANTESVSCMSDATAPDYPATVTSEVD